MKILYITPKANEFGGVAKVLSVKANALAKNHQVHIITQNSGWEDAPYFYNPSIKFYDIKLFGNKLLFLYRYRKALKQIINSIEPEIIFVSDNGLKAYLIPLLVKKKCPFIFEVRYSLYNEITKVSSVKFQALFHQLKYFYRRNFCKLYDYTVFLSKESQEEWKIYEKAFIIPNPIDAITEEVSNLDDKMAICVARNSYEKGLDRLLEIWQLVYEKNSHWKLKIIGVFDQFDEIHQIAKRLGIEKSVQIFPPTKDIISEYLNSSIYLMASRSEGFPNVLLEAQSCALPIVAYDCPIGPRSMIMDAENGFLITDGDKYEFAKKVELLIEDKNLRKKMGESGRKRIFKYKKEYIMTKWEDLINDVTNKK